MNALDLYKFILRNRDDKEKCLEAINAEYLREQLTGIATTEQIKNFRIDEKYPVKNMSRIKGLTTIIV
jgi:hypothetical protein